MVYLVEAMVLPLALQVMFTVFFLQHLGMGSWLRAFVPLQCPLYAFAVVHSMLSRTKLREMLGNENVHLYNSGDSDGGQIVRRRSTTRDSLPAVYLRNRNEICESMGPYASSRSLVNGRKAFGSAHVDHQGFYLDESKDMRDCEDPSLGRFRRVRDASHPESIIVLMDELPTVSHREVWSPASPYCLASPVGSPDANQTKDFDTEQKLSHKSSFRSGNSSNPNRTVLERVDEQALSCSAIDVYQPTLPELK
ncbi:hypothetical protein FFLO_04885 [Filobasidium floriforme]|uniref:Uncharacterized protein n=1 Tax=Filobasidium floriforme TaxID=5210 RepID=A0A8K0JIK0_9TREE|nr:uncharacterized protein HD553DRAFT_189576 [Filobasidium floriforme]KAG7530659.1 hypothetical protein FFLO_04885 [Filobasidium floriforme]KAH8088130.1 hypothetical protein HD553DRAFT_189576 [Filobasidium floriforme]